MANLKMIQLLNNAAASMEVLFPVRENKMIGMLQKFAALALQYLQRQTDEPEVGAEKELILVLNQLTRYCAGRTLSDLLNTALEDCAFDIYMQWYQQQKKRTEQDSVILNDLAFYLKHGEILKNGLKNMIPDFIQEIWKNDTEKVQLLYPSVFELTVAADKTDTAESLFRKLQQRRDREKGFGESRIYQYRKGRFYPLQLQQIRRIDEFYGYPEARRLMKEHYGDFSAGKENLPLLISSLPGLGKTQMTISYVLHFENLILILPGPEDMEEGLESLLEQLEQHPEQRFVLFFDDIDTGSVNWYAFRMRIGGAFSLPANVSVTVASNFEFPPNISSRGRGFTYPIFDEIRCMEMVGDYLISKGMRNPTSDLISVIAADYVEQFGQRKFEELSPRTLTRYLDHLNHDSKARSMMLKISQSAMVPRPDSQIFYAENLKLMRSFYGDEVIEDWRNKELQGTQNNG